ncbi:NAD(P)/FAD-dependent oxidoreductase [Flocculibacter collagenilyticus]|uniref:NAD(P)/FAD-dependent oxidoreductase n=1 Tax=Flocculibacter collagenilyticus TaxID=2744479 RepID=UPI0018F56238|nr:FAD-dependent oxidoreductase [Flocculibacter collagenilyticus]
MKIAVIGSGISGLTAAHLLSEKHEVSVFEANGYIGGHTNTVPVVVAGKTYQIDTGFIVFNDRTYPNFQKLLQRIEQGYQQSEMSFSVCNQQTGLEYNGHNLDTLFAQRRNMLSLRFYLLIKEIVSFNKEAKALYQSYNDDLVSLQDFIQYKQYSPYFTRHYLLPMVAAIWSCSLNDALNFPLKFFTQFFYHHGLLNITDRPQWFVIEGGSSSYIPALIESFKTRLHLHTPVERVSRQPECVHIESHRGLEKFDHVVFACHSDQALALLAEPTEQEVAVLSKMKYQANDVVLHTDKTMMPKRKKAWASWNFYLKTNAQHDDPALVTYYMNRLQGLPEDGSTPDFFVTLNGTKYIDEKKILRRFSYDHPVMNQAMIDAQAKRNVISGINNTHFCGAYWYNGFHEDGVKSALDVCKSFGVTL